MRIIIDQSIFLALESSQGSPEYETFFQYTQYHNCKLLTHQNWMVHISNLSVSEKFESLAFLVNAVKPISFPTSSIDNIKYETDNTHKNLSIENYLLWLINTGYAELLITENHEIFTQAQVIGCAEKVLSCKDALQYLKKVFNYTAPSHPILFNGSVKKIEPLRQSSFFDSLRVDYPGFDAWLSKCIEENRLCYYLTVDKTLSAILIYNIEPVEKLDIPGVFGDALKMCTFKTSESMFGLKMGELFLSKMFQLCVERNIHYLYLTTFEKQKVLIGLLSRYGFEKKMAPTNKQEMIMVKTINKEDIQAKDINKISCHPFYSDAPIFKKFVVPIQPEYYNTLFKDSSLRPKTLFDKQPDSLNEIQGNSIEKAYICNAKTKGLNSGDILFFYSSKKHKVIQPIGILDKNYSAVDSFEKLLRKVQGKTVFSENELKHIFDESSGKVTVFIFRLLYYLSSPIEIKTLRTLNCFSTKFVTVTPMPEEDYQKLKQEGHFDERYIINQT